MNGVNVNTDDPVPDADITLVAPFFQDFVAEGGPGADTFTSAGGEGTGGPVRARRHDERRPRRRHAHRGAGQGRLPERSRRRPDRRGSRGRRGRLLRLDAPGRHRPPAGRPPERRLARARHPHLHRGDRGLGPQRRAAGDGRARTPSSGSTANDVIEGRGGDDFLGGDDGTDTVSYESVGGAGRGRPGRHHSPGHRRGRDGSASTRPSRTSSAGRAPTSCAARPGPTSIEGRAGVDTVLALEGRRHGAGARRDPRHRRLRPGQRPGVGRSRRAST